MVKCPSCGSMNVANTLFCGECGSYLLDEEGERTDLLAPGQLEWSSASDEPRAPQPARNQAPLSIRLRIGYTRRTVESPLDKTIHLGRLDPANGIFPEVDLSPDGGVEKGVSRRHARILKREGVIVVEDLGSINGTFVNGQRLAPYLSEALHDGDQLQLGNLVIQVELVHAPAACA